ncbi:MAG: beta-lactamase family protein [Chitinophagaceae bacterium]|nr:beta-lactamase family protein [Chitinophagaceae bacterium]
MKIIPGKKIFLVILAFVIFQFQTVSYAQSFDQKIDSLLQVKYQPASPGAVFLIAQKGKMLYKKAFGLANLELNVDMKPDHIFEIGSITKQFTAVSILMLVEKGKLNLQDEITKFIPDYPAHGKKITVHHLLTHTSGIKDYTKMKALNDISQNDLTPLELIDFFKNEPMDFDPGEQFKYCNSGYVILGYIIESLSGQSYAGFVEDNIFKKAGMMSSFYANSGQLIKNRVSGYHKKDSYVNARHISFTLTYAAGSLMSNADDMLTWQNALSNNLLVNENTINQAFANYKLNNGNHINYGYGWFIKDINGIPDREHGGSIFGFKSMAVYLPGEDIYVIGLNNCDCNSPTEITKQIASLALENSMKSENRRN